MLWQIGWFEIRYWLRSWMLWLFLIVITLLIFAAARSDSVMNDLGLSNVYPNSPFSIATFYGIISVFSLLTTAIFVNSAALREIISNTQQIVYSTIVRRRDLLLGRLFGATVISLIPLLGVSFGILLAQYLPPLQPERWQPVIWTAHLKAILLFALLNTFFVAAIFFAAAIIWRKEIASFIALILLFIFRSVSGQLLHDIRWQNLRALLDPFGARAFAVVTKYWTIADKNTLSADLNGLLLWNRLIWLTVGIAAFALGYHRFRFTEKPGKTKVLEESNAVPEITAQPASQFTDSFLAKLAGSFRIHFQAMAKNPAFLVITMIAMAICIMALVFGGTRFQSNEIFQIFPVTYAIIDLIRGMLDFFLILIIIYFAGALVWMDRDARMDSIIDATPTSESVLYVSRLITLIVMVMLIQTVALTAGILFQALHGYHRFQFGLYLYEFLIRETSGLLFLAILAFFIHALSPNKYVGYFVFIIFYCANMFAWPALNVSTNMVQFARRPDVIYSDFFGDAPYRLAWNWFTLYWLLFCSLLAIVTVMFWPRGKQDHWNARARIATMRFTRRWKIAMGIILLAFLVIAGLIWYNTEFLNTVRSANDVQQIQAEYEKSYKRFDQLLQPRVRSVKYEIDLYPDKREVNVRGLEMIYNPYSQPLNEIHFTLDSRYDTSIVIPDAAPVKDDARLSYRIYRFEPSLRPGEERAVRFTVKNKNRGFENNVSNPQIVQNGTLLSNLGTLVSGANYLGPIIGYDYWCELSDSAQRKKYGLAEVGRMPAPERNCIEHCRDNYIPGHSDWTSISATISTTPDQIAVAPGSLVREWQSNGRRYFQYELDHPSMNLYCFASARYEVARENWNGIQLEVYYLKEHPWNISRMITAMKKSLDYYIKNFGPYAHKQARIVEFPRVAGYAAAFAGTMPYSESFGFIADLSNQEDIDNVFYVVAHEIAHQWWDEQVIGANMEGATLLSETLSQYSALMVMEKEYGRDLMRKFLKYEMDQYLIARGAEHSKELPLLEVEYQQSYIHYNKGSIAFYQLKEMIGEEALNRALRKLIHKYAYATAPYPTSYDLLDAFREETPPNLQYLIKDLFEDITLFSNRTQEASALKRADGKYEVTIRVESRKFKADSHGKETEVPVDDWIDIGAFAMPPEGAKYGATLYRERVHIAKRDCVFSFITAQLPDQAGIDPFALMIDRDPNDNMKSVTLQSVPQK